jgi:hypothetical protein
MAVAALKQVSYATLNSGLLVSVTNSDDALNTELNDAETNTDMGTVDMISLQRDVATNQALVTMTSDIYKGHADLLKEVIQKFN